MFVGGVAIVSVDVDALLGPGDSLGIVGLRLPQFESVEAATMIMRAIGDRRRIRARIVSRAADRHRRTILRACPGESSSYHVAPTFGCFEEAGQPQRRWWRFRSCSTISPRASDGSRDARDGSWHIG